MATTTGWTSWSRKQARHDGIKCRKRFIAISGHIPQTSTHSFRKFAGQQIYKNSGNDVEVAREFYQHSSISTTQTYIVCSSERLTQAINQSVSLPGEDGLTLGR
nr:MAG TPA: hypothetical protein [Caudoviricetes sp.]